MSHDPSALLAAIERDGYVVIPELLGRDAIDEMTRLLEPLLAAGDHGRNDFEGHRTQRIYSLVGRGRPFEDLAEHPLVLALCDALLEPNYLLTASQAIAIAPGETPQPPHYDDTFYSIPRPRPPVSISTIWALDAFTHENGATQVASGSHRWDQARVAQLMRAVDFSTRPGAPPAETPIAPELERVLTDAVMPAGSVIVFSGTLVHRGGRNRSTAPRLALSNQYCQPWARQQENFVLSIPRERVQKMSARVQALLGYSVHPPFMGHADGRHPRRWLDLTSAGHSD